MCADHVVTQKVSDLYDDHEKYCGPFEIGFFINGLLESPLCCCKLHQGLNSFDKHRQLLLSVKHKLVDEMLIKMWNDNVVGSAGKIVDALLCFLFFLYS